jgi:hypothetical protein
MTLSRAIDVERAASIISIVMPSARGTDRPSRFWHLTTECKSIGLLKAMDLLAAKSNPQSVDLTSSPREKFLRIQRRRRCAFTVRRRFPSTFVRVVNVHLILCNWKKKRRLNPSHWEKKESKLEKKTWTSEQTRYTLGKYLLFMIGFKMRVVRTYTYIEGRSMVRPTSITYYTLYKLFPFFSLRIV